MPVLCWMVCPVLEDQEHKMLRGYVHRDDNSCKVYSIVDEVDYFEAIASVYLTTNDKVRP